MRHFRMKNTSILILLLMIITGALATFKIISSSPNPLSSDPTPTHQPIVTTDDPKQLLDQFVAAFSAADSYSTTITSIASGSAVPSTVTIKYNKPDLTQSSFTDDSGGQTEVITTSSATYIKSAKSEKWLKLPQDTQTDLSDVEFNLDEVKQALASETNPPQYQGQQSCGQLTCYVFRLTDEKSTTDIYFDQTQLLLRQVKVTGSDNITMNYDYSPVNITAPSDSDVFVMPANPTEDDLKQAHQMLGM